MVHSYINQLEDNENNYESDQCARCTELIHFLKCLGWWQLRLALVKFYVFSGNIIYLIRLHDNTNLTKQKDCINLMNYTNREN